MSGTYTVTVDIDVANQTVTSSDNSVTVPTSNFDIVTFDNKSCLRANNGDGATFTFGENVESFTCKIYLQSVNGFTLLAGGDTNSTRYSLVYNPNGYWYNPDYANFDPNNDLVGVWVTVTYSNTNRTLTFDNGTTQFTRSINGYLINFSIACYDNRYNVYLTDMSFEIPIPESKYVNGNGVSEMWANIKNYIASQLLGKSNTGHTHSASDITSGLATVATSGSYNDLSNKPTIPTVNNATLTIQKNGTNVKTFTANASSDVTCNITVPTKTSDLTNDSGFITLQSLSTNSIAFHNAYPRCKYLGTSITDAQNTAIKNRTYDDLFIGDYWTINSINWRIVAIDYYYNVGNTNFDKGNIIVMPDTVLYNAQMNETNTTADAYAGSLMRTQNLNNARAIVQNAFGSHLANHRIILANAVGSSGPSNWAWYDSDGVELPNEVQIYGTRVWGSALKGFGAMTQKQQFPLMLFAPQFVNIRQTYWLQDVSSYSVSSHFALVYAQGNADTHIASLSLGVRPSVTLSYI